MKNTLIIPLLFFATFNNAKAQKLKAYNYRLLVDISALTKKPQALVIKYQQLKGNEMVDVIKQVPVNKRNIVVLQGVMDEPLKQAMLSTQPEQMMYGSLGFYLQQGEVHISTKENVGIATVESICSNTIDSLNQLEYKAQDAYRNTLSNAEKNVSSEDEQAYLHVMGKKEINNNKILDALYKPYIIKNAKTNPVAIYALEKYAGDSLVLLRSDALHTIDSLYNLLSADYQNTPTMMAVKKRIDAANAVAIGMPAPDFSQPDTSGKMVSLSSFRGHYVLLDFWASWCHWCRAETPNLLKAFNAYHNSNNFDIVSVSVDNENAAQAWRNAIKKDGAGLWAQLCEFSETTESNSAAAKYFIRAIPQTFLIDPEGKIIAVNVSGEALAAKLATIFSNTNAQTSAQ